MPPHPRRRPSTRSSSTHAGASRSTAFAEGRRLRRAAESRRRPATHRPLLWMVLLPLVLVVTTASVVTVVLGMMALMATVAAMFVLPALLLGTAAFVVVRHRRLRSAGTAPLPGRPAASPRPDLVWARSRDRFHALAAAYAAHECDPMNVLRLPALSDVSVPSTGRFVDAFAEAQALETDEHPGDEHAAAFVRAADRAERSWRAAREAAERIRLSGLTPAERHTVERVIKLLTTARDSDSEPERLAAYNRARTELDRLDTAGVVHLPRTARAALDLTARGTLPA